jgi:amidase
VRVGLPLWDEDAVSAYFADAGITGEEEQESLREVLAAQNESKQAIGETLTAAGVTVEEIPITDIPSGVDVRPLIEYGYKDAINTFLADLGQDAPVGSLEEIIAFNNADLANRAPYGQGNLEASQNTAITAEEFAQKAQENNGFAKNRIDAVMQAYDIDIIVSDVAQLYAPAGYPALTVPSGYAEDGTPQGLVFVGGFLSEPQLLAVGYAFEQSAQARVAPDLEATMALIQALTPQSAAGD